MSVSHLRFLDLIVVNYLSKVRFKFLWQTRNVSDNLSNTTIKILHQWCEYHSSVCLWTSECLNPWSAQSEIESLCYRFCKGVM